VYDERTTLKEKNYPFYLEFTRHGRRQAVRSLVSIAFNLAKGGQSTETAHTEPRRAAFVSFLASLFSLLSVLAKKISIDQA
jgi:hypothetical protein